MEVIKNVSGTEIAPSLPIPALQDVPRSISTPHHGEIFSPSLWIPTGTINIVKLSSAGRGHDSHLQTGTVPTGIPTRTGKIDIPT
ncbi:hypothetical protein L195_g053596 [Trifolium pratense]|uniref:Uncharacterized protein n=1 Tax=Trifolium pratense TaxID=57577 RepID=A0A2K3KBH6_TRIPR|nr:hypothetical protein L195_g053596 [Trifolium pratense]